MKKRIFILLITLCLVAMLSACDHTDDINSHTFGEWVIVTPATCEGDGFKVRYCDCGARHEDIIPQTGHNFIDGVCEHCGLPASYAD